MAKTRTVIVTLEMETDAPLDVLRSREGWSEALSLTLKYNAPVRQVTATVAQSPKVQPPKPSKGVKG